jgi:hypothetical protein
VIEAKVVRLQSTVAAARTSIEGAFIQLKKYLNDTPTSRPTTRRGVLLVYCFAPFVITYPHEWIRERYRIVAVDLSIPPPSKRTLSLGIEEGSVHSGAEIVVFDSSPTRSSTRKSKSKRSRGRH